MIPQDSSVYHSPKPSKPRIVDVEKTNICLICGDKGDLKRLIYCVQCKACAVHSYCQMFHGVDDGKVIWKCEYCAPNNPKCGSEQLRKSERISHATEAKYNRIKKQKESGAVRKQKSVRKSAKCLRKNDIEKRQQVLKDEKVLYEEPESLKDPLNTSSDKQALECEKHVGSETIMSHSLDYPEFDKCSRAQPLRDPIWTGLFIKDNLVLKTSTMTDPRKDQIHYESIVNSLILHLQEVDFTIQTCDLLVKRYQLLQGKFRLNNSTQSGLVAYMSSKACSKVHSAVTRFPRLLDVEMLLRRVTWPQSFDMFPPDGDSIALYFFPQYERDEMVFDGVLNDVIEQDLVLKAVIDNVELLIFSSHLLPPDDRRICKKYYLWGVFKTKPKNGNTQSN